MDSVEEKLGELWESDKVLGIHELGMNFHLLGCIYVVTSICSKLITGCPGVGMAFKKIPSTHVPKLRLWMSG